MIMRFTSKQELIDRIATEHRAFVELASSIPKARYREEGVWGDGWNVQDLFAHLTEWEQMFLGWYRTGRDGGNLSLPAPGFKWNQTPELNRAVGRKHHAKPVKKVLNGFRWLLQRGTLRRSRDLAFYSRIFCLGETNPSCDVSRGEYKQPLSHRYKVPQKVAEICT